MTHKDSGNYGEKRKDMPLNETIANKIKENIQGNSISCIEAHTIAEKLNVDPAEVGVAIDILEIRINKCQLGLFGYENKKNIPLLTEKVSPDMESTIKSSLSDGKLKCIDAWNIAKKYNISRPMVTAICESMKIKISACQLGAFK